MQKILIALVAFALLIAPQSAFAARFNQTFTIAAGTPVQLYPNANSPYMVKRISIQMAHGGTGIGYVMTGIQNGRTPAATNSSDLTAELAPASSTAPGDRYQDPISYVPSATCDIDLTRIWIDGSHTGDKVIVSYETCGN